MTRKKHNNTQLILLAYLGARGFSLPKLYKANKYGYCLTMPESRKCSEKSICFSMSKGHRDQLEEGTTVPVLDNLTPPIMIMVPYYNLVSFIINEQNCTLPAGAGFTVQTWKSLSLSALAPLSACCAETLPTACGVAMPHKIEEIRDTLCPAGQKDATSVKVKKMKEEVRFEGG